jgi:hypothetical protein
MDTNKIGVVIGLLLVGFALAAAAFAIQREDGVSRRV